MSVENDALTPIPSPVPVQAESRVIRDIPFPAGATTTAVPVDELLSSLSPWLNDLLGDSRDMQRPRDAAAPPSARARLNQSISNATTCIPAFLTKIPSVSGEFKHFLIASLPPEGRQSQASYLTKSCLSIFQVDDLLYTAAECQDGVRTKDLGSDPAEPFVVNIDSLPMTCQVNCNCEIIRLAPHPTNGALFLAYNTHTCVIFGLSSLGEVCGRLNLTPELSGGKDDILIKPIWLPGSSRYLTLLTSKSVQVCDRHPRSLKSLLISD